MTDPNRSQNEVPALLEERRRYENWLAALDAKREATPQHVFDRVHADYESRLQRVQERLAAHRHAIEEERTSLVSRRSLVEAEEQLRRDERAELELRVHVGELAGSDAETAFSTVDESLEKLTEEKDGLSRRIAELERLLDEKAAPAETAAEAPEQSARPADALSNEPESEPAEATVAADEEFIETPIALAAVDEPKTPNAESAPKAPTPAAAKPALSRDPLHTPGGSFDELAFLNDVVGEKQKGELASMQEESASESLLAGLSDPGRRKDGEAPLAANVPANTPIVLRTSGAIEQSKTLKCSECGAMNYPTEWYCERCGAELAAL